MNGNARTYEGMFLLEAGKGAFEAASEPVRTVLARNQAEVLALKNWDERKLAYDIGSHKRGLYVLAYFKADPAKIGEIERDCQLSESFLRALVLRRDEVTEAELAATTPATMPRVETPAPGAEGAAAPAAEGAAQPAGEEAPAAEDIEGEDDKA